MGRVRPTEAKRIIAEQLHALDPSLDERTAIQPGMNVEARSRDWWAYYDDDENARSDRNKGLLRSYELIGGTKLWAIGLPLDGKGRIWMDHSVMRRLLDASLVAWVDDDGSEPYFQMTDAGREFITE